MAKVKIAAISSLLLLGILSTSCKKRKPLEPVSTDNRETLAQNPAQDCTLPPSSALSLASIQSNEIEINSIKTIERLEGNEPNVYIEFDTKYPPEVILWKHHDSENLQPLDSTFKENISITGSPYIASANTIRDTQFYVSAYTCNKVNSQTYGLTPFKEYHCKGAVSQQLTIPPKNKHLLAKNQEIEALETRLKFEVKDLFTNYKSRYSQLKAKPEKTPEEKSEERLLSYNIEPGVYTFAQAIISTAKPNNSTNLGLTGTEPDCSAEEIIDQVISPPLSNQSLSSDTLSPDLPLAETSLPDSPPSTPAAAPPPLSRRSCCGCRNFEYPGM